jgi:ubiquinone/menaquinone biosynthesis C-methylase UbiE
LPHYNPHLSITGIDVSASMLDRARALKARLSLDHVEALLEMDGTQLAFADEMFDANVAMFVMTVVPNPAAVMSELRRMTRKGGQIIILITSAISEGCALRWSVVFHAWDQCLVGVLFFRWKNSWHRRLCDLFRNVMLALPSSFHFLFSNVAETGCATVLEF